MAKKLQVKFFTIPLCGDRGLEEELNHFLQTRQIISLDKGLADQAWNFCITYVGTYSDLPSDDGEAAKKTKGMKDYKKELKPIQYALYLRLHNLRNRISEERRIDKPLIFQNEEMSQMAVRRCSSLGELQKISGIGAKKAEAFGEDFLRAIAEFVEERADEIATEEACEGSSGSETTSEGNQERE